MSIAAIHMPVEVSF